MRVYPGDTIVTYATQVPVSGLVGTIGFTIPGVCARTTVGIVEEEPNTYRGEIECPPVDPGEYGIYWDLGDGTDPVLDTEVLLVRLRPGAGRVPDETDPYKLQIGPLLFLTALSEVSETLGDTLEAVGASLISGERRPRAFKLTLPVRGSGRETDDVAVGRLLRRQVRGLVENRAWMSHGLPMSWAADPDLDCWLLAGGADLAEDTRGLTFGEFKLDLTDCYVAGRPGTHRAGRRIDLADRRTGLVARDTFGRIYTTDFASVALPTSPVALPGDVRTVTGLAGVLTTIEPTDPRPDGRVIYQTCAGTDGNIITYEPYLPDAEAGAHLLVDLPGQTRVWDTAAASLITNTSTLPGQTPAHDQDPDAGYGWQRVTGPGLTAARPLAVDNGLCRVRWNGADFVIEKWVNTSGYVPVGLITDVESSELHMFPVEVTGERVVIEYQDVGSGTLQRTRIILQRGWPGPRVEALALAPTSPAGITLGLADGTNASMSASTPTWLTNIKNGATTKMRAAAIHAGVTATLGTLSDPDTISFEGDVVVGVQIDARLDSGYPLAGLSLVDCRQVPVLVER